MWASVMGYVLQGQDRSIRMWVDFAGLNYE